MARGRNIKPGFFHNEFLAAKSPAVRLLFIGLWTLADREGRLEDRPNRIKGFLFPYENLDVNLMLDDLATISDEFQDHPFIVRYRVDGKRYIQICKFLEHQAPHIKEVASIIPPCPEVENQPSTKPAPDEHSASTDPAPEISVQAPGAHGASPSDSPFPFPLSINKRARAPHARDVQIPKQLQTEEFLLEWRKWEEYLETVVDANKRAALPQILEAQIQEIYSLVVQSGRPIESAIEALVRGRSVMAKRPAWEDFSRRAPPTPALVESKEEKKPPRKRDIF